ncbi:MAG: DUF5908 family protein [Deltaproteobacteria bacterium]|nr:DUF5908 family protein [Deltaproteobacteria bacterium]
MPVEIRELVIKASVTESASEQQSVDSSESGASDREEIIADCVEQVMEILRKQSER